MRYLRLGLTAMGALGLLALSGCISFRSTSVVASFGQLVGSRAAAVAMFPTFCETENIFAGAQPTCPVDQIQRYTAELTSCSQLISRYSTTLRNLADFKDPRLSDELNQTLLGLSRMGEIVVPPDDRAGQQIASAAAQVTSILSQGWRRDKIEKLVESTHPHLLVILDGMLGRTKLLSESARYLVTDGLLQQSRMLQDVDAAPGATADPLGRRQRQAERVALLHFQLTARRGHDALVEYQKALQAFQRAHTILFEFVTQHQNGLADDGEMYELLKKTIPPILNVPSAANPSAANPSAANASPPNVK